MRVEIHDSARRHAIADDDIKHAVAHALSIDVLDAETEDEWLLVLGPDRAGNILEVVVIVLANDDLLAIHAMKMRPKYRDLLPRDE